MPCTYPPACRLTEKETDRENRQATGDSTKHNHSKQTQQPRQIRQASQYTLNSPRRRLQATGQPLG